MQCPKGHTLPYSVNKVQCAPNACASDNVPMFPVTQEVKASKGPGRPPKAKKENKRVSVGLRDLNDANEESVALARQEMVDAVPKEHKEEAMKLARNVSRYEARKAYMKTPEVIEDPKAYVDARLTALLPDAVDRLGFDLKLGDEDASRQAAKDILDRTGFGKRDGTAMPGAPIMIVVNGAVGDSKGYTPPWAQVVDGKADKK